MSYIKTWVERCDEHPDHQSGMVSNGMIQARMQEEIDDLREEIERLTSELKKARTEVENLYDQVHRWVDDRAKAQLQADRLRDQSYELQRQRDEARAEVARLREDLALEKSRIVLQRGEIEKLRADNERLRANLRECACDCSSIRECVSEWARDGKCPHADARNALEGKP